MLMYIERSVTTRQIPRQIATRPGSQQKAQGVDCPSRPAGKGAGSSWRGNRFSSFSCYSSYSRYSCYNNQWGGSFKPWRGLAERGAD